MAPRKKDPTAKLQGVFGSDVQPAMIELAEGVSVQLGDAVRRALEKSGLSADAWNDLPADQREEAIAVEIETMKSEAASASTDKNTRSEESGDVAGSVSAEPVKPQDPNQPTPDMSSDAETVGSRPDVEASSSGTVAAPGEPMPASEESFSFTLLKPARINGRKRMPGTVVSIDRDQLQALDAQRVINIEE